MVPTIRSGWRLRLLLSVFFASVIVVGVTTVSLSTAEEASDSPELEQTRAVGQLTSPTGSRSDQGLGVTQPVAASSGEVASPAPLLPSPDDAADEEDPFDEEDENSPTPEPEPAPDIAAIVREHRARQSQAPSSFMASCGPGASGSATLQAQVPVVAATPVPKGERVTRARPTPAPRRTRATPVPTEPAQRLTRAALAATATLPEGVVRVRCVVSDVNITFYDCLGQDFCGAMYNGVTVYEGAAACSWDMPLGTRFRIRGDPTGRIYYCGDRGLLDNTWVDIFWYDPTNGWAWQAGVGRYGTLEIVD